MDLVVLIAFVSINLLLDLTPGPAVLRVVSDAMGNGALRTQATIAGISAANLIYCLVAVGLMAMLVAAVPQLFASIKLAGLAYLVWLGGRSFRSAWIARGVEEAEPTAPASAFALARAAFALQIRSHHTVLFYCALLPVFACEAEGAGGRMAWLGPLAVALEWPVLALYAHLAERATAFARRPGPKRMFDALSGLILLGASGLVARTSIGER